MSSNQTDSSQVKPLVKRSTSKVIELLEENREHLLTLWVERIRKEFNQPKTTSNHQLADHMIYIIDALISEFHKFDTDPNRWRSTASGDMLYNEGPIEDKKDAGENHGRQRAGINAYNADKVYWEYVLLRKIIVAFVQKHRLLDVDHLEIITCVIESCSRESLRTFSKTLQKVQSKLLGAIIHDIRSPLNAISMMGEIITMKGHSEKTATFAHRIVESSGRIGAMLEDMLLTLAVEAGQGLDLTFSESNLNDFLSATASEVQTLLGARMKINLPQQDIIAIFDENVLKRVFENLISNAFKYGDNLTDVTISASETDDLIIMDVHNFGKPIKEEHWQDIFLFLKRFEGQDGVRDKSWGIGLAFAKAAIEGHRGKIIVSSDAIQGTRFLIELPKHALQKGSSTTVPI